MALLTITNLNVSVKDTAIIHDVSLSIEPGTIHVIMGKNGSGKSTLANTLAGHPAYDVTKGTIMFDGHDITTMAPDERAKSGLFLSMQQAPEIPGVTINSFLRTVVQSLTGEQQHPVKFFKTLTKTMQTLKIDQSFASRHLNVGFSGGEKKRLEVLQLLMMQPKLAILDETDSGLDLDALKIVADGVNSYKNENNALLIITHNPRLLELLTPDMIHIMKDGSLVKSGGMELVQEVEEHGFEQVATI